MHMRCPNLCGPVTLNIGTFVVLVIVTQLHFIISAPIASAPADDVTASSWRRDGNDDVTVLSNAESVRSNAIRVRRQLYESQACGPVCNRCRQVLSLRYSALCLLECESGLIDDSTRRHYNFCLAVLADPPAGLIPNPLPTPSANVQPS